MNIFLNKAKSQLAVDSIMGSKATDLASMVVTRILVLLIVGLWLFSGINAVHAQEVDLEKGLINHFPLDGNGDDLYTFSKFADIKSSQYVDNDLHDGFGKAILLEYEIDLKITGLNSPPHRLEFNDPRTISFWYKHIYDHDGGGRPLQFYLGNGRIWFR